MSSKRGRVSNSFEDKVLFSNIGARFELLKKEKGISNKVIAERLGISEQSVSKSSTRLRHGEGIELPTLARLAKALGIEVKEFF